MNNSLLQIKIQERLNKLGSQDYGNIEPYIMVEAFNKAQSAWVRRQLEGINQTKTGSEGSRRRIDDLQVILTDTALNMVDKGVYWESTGLPDNYLEWNRVSTMGKNDCCPARKFVVFEAEEADIDMLLSDKDRQPSFEWATTFATMMTGNIRIYTNNTFEIVEPVLNYFRIPRNIEIAGSQDPSTGLISPVDITCEFRDTVTELLVDDTAAIIAGDFNDYYNNQRLTASAEHNN